MCAEWLTKKTNKFTSPKMQNEMIEVMALQILRDIAKNIQSAEIYSILADETADISNVEQLTFCIRWVDDNLVPTRILSVCIQFLIHLPMKLSQ